MRLARQFLALSVCLFSFLPSVSAQEAQSAATISKEATIIIEQRQVRFTGRSPVEEMRLQVFDHVGELVYDSGASSSQEIIWPLQNGNGEELKNGLYAYTLSIKEVGAETARVWRGHFIVDRAKDRDGATDKLWVTSQNDNGVGAELTVARDENATVAGASTTIERTVGRSTENSKRDAGGREVEAETQHRSDASKTASAAAPAGTAGKIAKFTTATEVGDSGITELNGNIGIGTTTPLQGRLHVHSDGSTSPIVLSTGSGSEGPALFKVQADSGLSGQGRSFVIYDENAKQYRMVINGNGGVGFGTTIPTSSRLTLEGQDALSVRGYEPFITFIDGNHGNARGAIQQVNGGLNLFTDGYLRGANPFGFLRLDNSGNVGIGAADPKAKLVVASGSGDIFHLVGYEPFITFYDSNHGYVRGAIQQVGGGLNLFTDSYLSGANPLGYLRLDNSGNVGIGTANPFQRLHVLGDHSRLRLQSTKSDVWTVTEYTTDAREWHTGVGGSTVPNDLKNKYYIFDATASRARLTIDTNGVVSVDTLRINGADFAERFDVSSAPSANSEAAPLKVEAGMVVSIDPTNPGKLRLSKQAYDHRVAGIISGAGGVKPGMVMSQEGTLADGQYPVALSGRVYCYVDASQGAVEPGDLLTTSATPGHAMKVADSAKAQGAIIGKAMTGLKEGKGLALVLVTLQ